MKKNIYNILFLLLIYGCESEKLDFRKIQFENNYEFTEQIDSYLKNSTEPWRFQSAAWDYSNIGQYRKSLTVWDEENKEMKSLTIEQIDSFINSYTPINASKYILEKAKENQIIIINEAHHQPLHRVFTSSLLEELFKLGYKNLGIETLSHGDLMLNERKYPELNSGTYSVEPQYGELIRNALSLGYYIFPYERKDGSNGKDREIGQANNIFEQIKNRPNEKFIIHCGFAHAAEGPYKSWGKAMAGRLAEFSGIDPLTINQVTFTERSNENYHPPLYKALTIQEPTIFVDSMMNSYKDKDKKYWFDLFVFHPKTKMINGRPNWLWNNGKTLKEINIENLDIDCPCLILVYKNNEDVQKSVPIDIIEVTKKEKAFLALNNETYKVIIVNTLNEARISTLDLSF